MTEHEHHEHHEHHPEHHAEHHAQSHHEKKGPNVWMITTIVFAIALIAVGALAISTPKIAGNAGQTGANLDANKLANKGLNYLKTNIFNAQGVEVKLASVERINDGLVLANYKLTKDGQTQDVPAYLTADGKKLIAGQVLELDAPIPQQPPATQPQNPPAQTTAKSDKPVVELFVMSYCPYGNQAEAGIIPALKLLGNSVDFKIRYIVSKQGNDYTSLHGAEELAQDVRELCIQKNMPDKFIDYVNAVNTACNLQNISTCWKTEATKLSLDTAKIEQCAVDEKIALLDAEIAATAKYGVSGSPTLIINDGPYNGGRSAEEYKAGMCGAFNTAPATCGQTLSAAGAAAASGGCVTP
ncbi:MAG: hypothetical protein Q7R70_01530 [Candidatus Diapherotrites archaeon]|nr:hypothetical protein [Candidatus Diapherotrites archaeon]